ncbi:alpha/beta hydrolase [Roseomonas hellenica]|uniref:Alpha/beta hydrolase n=1 Tax=Plastoroseomonas hellenica TaxID=2687306 RepID=A0ABS5EXI8_9PROT|nr:alpha/beta hydrolase [Plastoroseomonas hellenica]MBR0665009.1 alpha/beta hydrolase [Plastoroseomonas hellenica]
MSITAMLADALTAPGRNAIPFVDEEGDRSRPLTLHTYRAERYTPERPLVLVQHGMKRNGDEYRDFWIPAADKYGLLIVAPTFSNEHYPTSAEYNDGLVRDAVGGVRPKSDWAYASIARIVALLRDTGVTARPRAWLYGHSAGGQFGHRLLSTQPHDAYEAVIIGNPGWYTLPTLDRPFPEGLGGIGLGEAELARLLAYPLTILAGDRDIETSGPSLPAQPEATAQGPHRLARAHNYVAFGHAEALRRNLPCHWRLQVVPGIGHDGDAMSQVAASLWFEGRMPDAAALARLAAGGQGAL